MGVHQKRARRLFAVRAFLRARFSAVLRDTKGSTVEALAATVLSVLIIGLIASGSVAAMTALGVSTGNAERVQELATLVEKPARVGAWKSAADAPVTYAATLPSGTVTDLYLWVAPAPDGSGSTFHAAAPRPDNDNPSSCASIAEVVNGCLYAARFHGADVRTIRPANVPGLVVKDLSAPVAIASVFAHAPATAGTWRYLIEVSAAGADGSVVFLQGSNALAVVPVGTTADIYFGTLEVVAGEPVTVLSPDRSVTVTDFSLYKAGA